MHKYLSLLLVFVFVAAVSPNPSFAQREAQSFSAAKPLPEIPFMSEDAFKSQTKLVRNKSPNDEFLAYEIRVPKTWTEIQQQDGESTLDLSLKLFNSLATYESPIGNYNKKSILQIEAIELQSTITPERWLLEYMLSLGYHVEYMGIYSDSRAEAIIAYIDKGQNYIERLVVEINGRRALLVSYSMPIEAWNDTKVLQAQVLDSFNVLNEFVGEVDNFNKYSFLDVAEIRYPIDWTLREQDIRNADRMTANVLNLPNLSEDLREANEINGRIEVELVSFFGTENLTTELARQREEFAESFKFEDQYKVDMKSSYFINPAFDFAQIEAYATPPTTQRVLEKELWMASMAAGNYYYFVKMLTPSRKSDYYTWLRNVEVYKIVLEGIRPNLNTKIFDVPKVAQGGSQDE